MNRRHGRWLFLVVLLAGVLGFVGIWSAAPGAQERGPEFGGVYVEGIAGAPARVNPLYAGENAVDSTLVSLVFAGLTRLDERGVPFPDLAETWTVRPDGLVYTFYLRSGLTWHDGAPLTARDIVFTYELLQSPQLRNAPPLKRTLEDAVFTAADDRTVVVELDRPYSPLPAFLTLGILPAHLLGNTAPGSLYDSPFNQQPVGAGPYRVEALSQRQARLAPNPAYHFDQPFIQRLELHFFRDDGALFDALTARQVSGGLFAAGVGPGDFVALDRRRDLRVSALTTGELTYVYLNLSLPIFEDRRLRQALLYAIDRDSLVRDVLRGQAVRADSPIPPGNWAHSPSLSRYESNRELASLLLEEAGWTEGVDGVRRRAGQALAFTLHTSPDPVHVEVARRVAEAWNEMGARVTVQETGLTVLVRDIIEQRSYEAVLFVNASGPDPDPYSAWHSSGAGGRGGNLARFDNARVDALLEEARAAAAKQRQQLYYEFQEIFAQEVPAIPLYATTVLYAQNASVAGVRIGRLVDPGDRFWQVQEWFLRTR